MHWYEVLDLHGNGRPLPSEVHGFRCPWIPIQQELQGSQVGQGGCDCHRSNHYDFCQHVD